MFLDLSKCSLDELISKRDDPTMHLPFNYNKRIREIIAFEVYRKLRKIEIFPSANEKLIINKKILDATPEYKLEHMSPMDVDVIIHSFVSRINLSIEYKFGVTYFLG